jgi:hypothetical protein
MKGINMSKKYCAAVLFVVMLVGSPCTVQPINSTTVTVISFAFMLLSPVLKSFASKPTQQDQKAELLMKQLDTLVKQQDTLYKIVQGQAAIIDRFQDRQQQLISRMFPFLWATAGLGVITIGELAYLLWTRQQQPSNNPEMPEQHDQTN